MKNEELVSLITAFFFAVITYFVLLFLEIEDALLLSVLSGLLFYLLLLVFLLIERKIQDKKYAKYEKEITSPIFCKANAVFRLDNDKLRDGKLYFCEAGIVCISLSEKPHMATEILLPDIQGYRFDGVELYIFTNDGRTAFLMTADDAKKTTAALREKGWTEFKI